MMLLRAIPYIIGGVIVYYSWSYIWDILVAIQQKYGMLVVILSIIAFMLFVGAIDHWNKKGK